MNDDVRGGLILLAVLGLMLWHWIWPLPETLVYLLTGDDGKRQDTEDDTPSSSDQSDR